MMASSALDEQDRLTKLAKRTSFRSMYNFTITHDRHKHLYGIRESNFPASYKQMTDMRNMVNDPDIFYKIELKRVNFKKLFAFGIVVFLFLKRKERMVAEFDRQKRIEQRNMQNTEIEEVFNKQVRYVLFDSNGNKVDQNSFKGSY